MCHCYFFPRELNKSVPDSYDEGWAHIIIINYFLKLQMFIIGAGFKINFITNEVCLRFYTLICWWGILPWIFRRACPQARSPPWWLLTWIRNSYWCMALFAFFFFLALLCLSSAATFWFILRKHHPTIRRVSVINFASEKASRWTQIPKERFHSTVGKEFSGTKQHSQHKYIHVTKKNCSFV